MMAKSGKQTMEKQKKRYNGWNMEMKRTMLKHDLSDKIKEKKDICRVKSRNFTISKLVSYLQWFQEKETF